MSYLTSLTVDDVGLVGHVVESWFIARHKSRVLLGGGPKSMLERVGNGHAAGVQMPNGAQKNRLSVVVLRDESIYQGATLVIAH